MGHSIDFGQQHTTQKEAEMTSFCFSFAAAAHGLPVRSSVLSKFDDIVLFQQVIVTSFLRFPRCLQYLELWIVMEITAKMISAKFSDWYLRLLFVKHGLMINSIPKRRDNFRSILKQFFILWQQASTSFKFYCDSSRLTLVCTACSVCFFVELSLRS